MTNIKAVYNANGYDNTTWAINNTKHIHNMLLDMQANGDVIHSVSIDAIKRTTTVKCTDKRGNTKFVDSK